MLSRLTSDINVDYDKIHQLRKHYLEYVSSLKLKDEATNKLCSLIFTNGNDYPETLDDSVLQFLDEEGQKRYNAIRKAIGDSRKENQKIEEKIFNLLIYSIKEIPDKPKMWLRILDFCIYHLPEKINKLYSILKGIQIKGDIHLLGYEYIVSVMNIHLALQVQKTISRLFANKYKDPWKKIIDEMLLTQFEELSDKYDGTHHYLYEDAKFLVGRVKMSLKKYQGNEGDNGYLDACNYHGMDLDSSFWLLWHIERFNKSKPNPVLFVTDYLMEDLNKADVNSKYFIQLLFTCISHVSLSKFGKQDFSKLKLSRRLKENLLLSVWGQDSGNEVIKNFELPKQKMTSPNNKISLMQWMKEVKLMEEEDANILGNALYSEYCATFIMESVIKYYCDNIEQIDEISLHPASILVRREECLKFKDWDSWLSPQKEVNVETKDSLRVQCTGIQHLSPMIMRP